MTWHRNWRCSLGMALFLTLLFPHVSLAVTTVEQHDLACTQDFPCPQGIQRRVDFWVHVYRTWTTKDAILHDSKHPERVFEVIDSPNGCKNSKGRNIKSLRARLKSRMIELASKIDKGGTDIEQRDRMLINLYPHKSATAIRSAASRIRCQQGNRDRFIPALKRYGTYRDLVERILLESELSSDIQFLPFVESLYNPRAYSRVGAAGLWQIMPRTARHLGLELNATMDERLDPEAATWAAARYLNNSTRSLRKLAAKKYPDIDPKSLNPFVITSYNYGLSGMRRALSKVGPDFVEVLQKHKSPSFRVAVKNFYASFLAARHVALNASRYFGNVKGYQPIQYDTVLLEQPTSLDRIKKVFSVDETELKKLNGALTRFAWHEWRFLPEGYRLRLPLHKAGWKAEITALRAMEPEEDAFTKARYKVKRGDTACGIAHAFGIGCRALISANQLGRGAFLRIGQVLTIPGSRVATSIEQVEKVKIPAAVKSLNAEGKYVVRRGDSACKIASRFDVTCRELITRNRLGRRAIIRIGQRLRIPGIERSTLAAAIADPGISVAAHEEYIVKKGDYPCQIAKQFNLGCEQFLQQNKLKNRSLIYPGQKLTVVTKISPSDGGQHQFATKDSSIKPADSGESPPASQVTTVDNKQPDLPNVGLTQSNVDSETFSNNVIITQVNPQPILEIEPVTNRLDAALDIPIDTTITITKDEPKKYTIQIEAEETLGHYSDWLGIRSTRKLRQINHIKPQQSLRIGRTFQLPAVTKKTKQSFEQKRHEYHRVLIEEFKENYAIVKLENYQVRSGDNLWDISQHFELPIWVVSRFNPELRKRPPNNGEVLTIPIIHARDKDQEAPRNIERQFQPEEVSSTINS